jgi:hypothetical protein
MPDYIAEPVSDEDEILWDFDNDSEGWIESESDESDDEGWWE